MNHRTERHPAAPARRLAREGQPCMRKVGTVS
ncbi:MAG: hypothetical protein QOE51_4944 [Actinoplanes sp.]|nr:hypothetical protein [Actinoplanes sp.]